MTEDEFVDLLGSHRPFNDDYYGWGCCGDTPACDKVDTSESYARHIYSLM